VNALIPGPVARRAPSLLLAAGLLLAPPIGHAQFVPPVPNPVMVAAPCPACKKMFNTPGGRMPSSCPLCGYSFVQPAKSRPAPQTRPQLKTSNPFGDYLFDGVPIVPDDSKLETRHLDPEGLAARAEAWGKQMKQMDAQLRENRQARGQDFEREKQGLLNGLDTSRANGPALRQLKNIYAGEENGWDTPSPEGVRIPDNAKVKLLRGPEPGGEPIAPKKFSERSLDSLTDRELAQRSAENEKEIDILTTAARRDVDIGLREQRVWAGAEADLTAARGDLVKATRDAMLYGAFTGGEKMLKDAGHDKWEAGVTVVDKSVAIAQGSTEISKASGEGNLAKGGAAVGDIALAVIPDQLVEKGLLTDTFAKRAGLVYAGGKFGIEYTAALGNLAINGDTIEQFDSRNTQRTFDTTVRGEKLRQLFEDQKRIKAELERRAQAGAAP
jgi:hypothetical protein